MKFAEGSKKENLVPLRHIILSDHLTPVLAYPCLVKEDDQEAQNFLFEFVEPGHHSSTVGRYSVVGAHPKMEINVAKENKVTVMDHVKGTLTTEDVEDPMLIPRRISETWKPQLIDDLPESLSIS